MLKTFFRLSLPPSHPLKQIKDAWELQKGVFALLDEYGLDEMATTETAFRQGSDIFFRMSDHSAADNIVRQRCCLKGTGISIMEVLSPEEATQHAALWPQYEKAIAAGKRAQFCRSRLKIDGVWVS